MSNASARPRLRLLPPDSGLGWTPYAWLIYLATYLIEPIDRSTYGAAGAGYWAITIAGLAAFLVAYFYGYWARGGKLLRVAFYIAGLGFVLSFMNVGAGVFFIYAASFAGNLDPARIALRYLLVIVALGVLTALLIDPPLFYHIMVLPIALLVGGVNLHFAQDSRARRSLRLAQEEVRHLAAVAERERIARDLHDVLGHTLSLIVLKSELAARLVGQDAARAAAEMRDVEDVARRTLQDVREAIRGYRASLQDEAARARSMLRAASIRDDVDVPAHELPLHVEETLALTLREAVTNVVRHSGATTCSARLMMNESGVTLTVSDNGRGTLSAEGTGLRGMRERVEAFGGRISRAGDGGSTISVTLPLRAGSNTEPLLRESVTP